MKDKYIKGSIDGYPILKRNPNTGLVVDFTAPKTGVVVHESGFYPVGTYRTDWYENNFEVYHEKQDD